jgi:2'-5' RNA ligase
MRLFVALQLPAEVREPLAEKAARLHPRLPPARWVPAANLHLTLQFLGETGAGQLPGLDSVLAGCFRRHGPFRLRLSDGGCFPANRPARVAWVGFAPCPALMELQATVAVELHERLGITREGRAFHAHLTLARPRRPWPRAAVNCWREVLAGRHGPAFDVLEGHLMRSHLGPDGARHGSLEAYPLKGRGGVAV